MVQEFYPLDLLEKHIQIASKTFCQCYLKALILKKYISNTMELHSILQLQKETFQMRISHICVGRGGPQNWLSRSLDFNLLDYAIWGYPKSKLVQSVFHKNKSQRRTFTMDRKCLRRIQKYSRHHQKGNKKHFKTSTKIL